MFYGISPQNFSISQKILENWFRGKKIVGDVINFLTKFKNFREKKCPHRKLPLRDKAQYIRPPSNHTSCAETSQLGGKIVSLVQGPSLKRRSSVLRHRPLQSVFRGSHDGIFYRFA